MRMHRFHLLNHIGIRKVLHSKGGFTLLEVILGMSISTILMLSIVTLLPIIQLNYVNSIETSYSQVMASNIADALKNQIAFSYVQEITAEHIVYYSEFSLNADGVTELRFDEENPQIAGLTYDKNYYMSKRVQVSVKELSVETSPYRDFEITVTVYSTKGSNKLPYVLTRNVRQFHS